MQNARDCGGSDAQARLPEPASFTQALWKENTALHTWLSHWETDRGMKGVGDVCMVLLKGTGAASEESVAVLIHDCAHYQKSFGQVNDNGG